MKDQASFSAFRYFLIPTDQISFFDDIPEKKERALDDFFNTLKADQKYAHGIKEKRHLLVLSETIGTDIFVCKFGKEQVRDLFIEDETDIVEKEEVNFPYVFALIDKSRQMMLIQNKSSVFSSIHNVKECISTLFEAKLDLRGFLFKMEEIADEKSFWNYIDSSDGVYSISFTLNSPNLFGGRIELNELLKEATRNYNNTETTIGFKNTEPKIRTSKDNKFITDAVKYTSGGGGSWILGLFMKGKRVKKKSKDLIRSVKLPLPSPEIKQDSKIDMPKIIRDAFDNVETILQHTSKDDKEDS